MRPFRSLAKALLSLTLACLLGTLGTVCALAAPAPMLFFTDGALFTTIEADDTQPLTLPAPPAARADAFVGWVATDGASEALYPAGAVLAPAARTPGMKFHALYADVQTLDGAAAGIGEPFSLRFDATIGADTLSRLLALVGKERLAAGILTAPYFNHGAGNPPTRDSAHVTDTPADVSRFTANKAAEFSARVTGITPRELFDKFSARAYVTVTFADNTQKTIYAAFRFADHARAVHSVLAAAYEDNKQERTEGYENAFAFEGQTYYSPYSEADRTTMAACLDYAVCVETPVKLGEQVRVVNAYSMNMVAFKPCAFYRSPYVVASVVENDAVLTITVVGENGADFRKISTYAIGGSYSPFHLANATTTEQGFVIRQSLETGLH